MADYTKPPIDNIPFRFGTGGYTAPDFDDIRFRFKSRPIISTYSNIGANIIGYSDYIKYCPTYVIGYGIHGIQIIKGRCIYGGIRDLCTYIEGISKKGQSDLSTSITGRYSHYTYDLISSIVGFGFKNLPSSIGGHLPVDLVSIIGAFTFEDLGSTILPIPGRDLSARIKTPPQYNLPSNVYGWQDSEFLGVINPVIGVNLPSSIGGHLPKNISARLRGWAIEEISDLGGSVTGFAYENLGALIRSTYLVDLHSTINPVPSVDLISNIYAWDTYNLPSYINGYLLDTDLQASIFGSGAYKNLPSYIKSVVETNVSRDLGVNISSYIISDLNSYLNPIPYVNLPTSLIAVGGSSSLGGEIVPKVVMLSSVISFITMEGKDLYAVINVCHKSDSSNLSAYIKGISKNDLRGIIIPVWDKNGYSDLSAKIGRENFYLAIDKFDLNVYITNDPTYWTEDKLSLNFDIWSGISRLGSSINGVLRSSDLGANLNALIIKPYGFENTKHREKVYTLNRTGEMLKFEVVEISFRSIVSDYFYNSSNGVAYKKDRLEKWVTEVKSYIPMDRLLNAKRRLHKMTTLHNISKFDTLDDALKFAIHYVTEYPEEDLGASITAVS